jgi:hypothetical protein
MALNIKNHEAHLLAEELSKLTGESVTAAVTIALRERLARVRQQQGLSLAVDFWRSAGTARRASRNRSVPPIMATSFMTNADWITSMIVDASACHRRRLFSSGAVNLNGQCCLCTIID